MALVAKETDFSYELLDADLVVVTVKGQRLVLDYSTLMDVVTNLAVIAAQMEQTLEKEPEKTQAFELH